LFREYSLKGNEKMRMSAFTKEEQKERKKNILNQAKALRKMQELFFSVQCCVYIECSECAFGTDMCNRLNDTFVKEKLIALRRFLSYMANPQ
jgi:hypothetical protein